MHVSSSRIGIIASLSSRGVNWTPGISGTQTAEESSQPCTSGAMLLEEPAAPSHCCNMSAQVLACDACLPKLLFHKVCDGVPMFHKV